MTFPGTYSLSFSLLRSTIVRTASKRLLLIASTALDVSPVTKVSAGYISLAATALYPRSSRSPARCFSIIDCNSRSLSFNTPNTSILEYFFGDTFGSVHVLVILLVWQENNMAAHKIKNIFFIYSDFGRIKVKPVTDNS